MERKIFLLGKGGTKVAFDEKQVAKIIQSRALINEPGKYQIIARQISEYTTENYKTKIVNLQAHTVYGRDLAFKYAKEAIATEDIDAASELWQKAMNTNLTANIFIGEDGSTRGYLPKNGESVNIIVDYFTTKEGEQALGVVANGIFELPIKKVVSTGSIFTDLFSDTKDLDEINNTAKKIFEKEEK